MVKPAIATILFMVCATPLAQAETRSPPESTPAPTENGADYGVLLGVSPFGGSFTLSYHASEATTWQCSLGGNPEGTFDVQVDSQSYVLRSSSAWLGWFVNHRPFETARWFRIATGFAIGNISHRVEDSEGNIFAIDYQESPVGYLGVGAGVGTTRGFTFGFDIGWLQSAGPRITFDRGPADGEPGALSEDARHNRLDALSDSYFFGSVMLNIQLGLGYNF